MDKKKITSKFFILIGVICIVIASIISGDNFYKDYKARKLSLEALKVIEEQVNIDKFNYKGEGRMTTIDIDKNKYIGILKIPKLSMALPIQNDWSYEKLNISPCRYVGSVNDDSMVLMGHNYKSQFSSIKKLSLGDEVIFVDAEGVEYVYFVKEKDTIHKNNVDEMISKEWDLTLFTCDYTRVNRTTIRCERKI